MAMANGSHKETGWNGQLWRVLGWGLAVMLLLLPLVANAPWTASDFVIAAILMGGVGLLFELTVRMSPSRFYRAGAGVALAATFLTLWANGAVGMIGDEDKPLNLMFAGVIALALLGAIMARFRAPGMAFAMSIAAAAQLVAGLIGTFTDLRGGILSALFAGLWLLAAGLFRAAARERGSAGAAPKG